jgi:DNA-binding beta-propeller fold protein YncE
MPIMNRATRALLASLALQGPSLLGCTRGHVVNFDSSTHGLTVALPALYPETLEYDSKSDKFLLSSFRNGAIYEVDSSGNASLRVADPRLCSVLGIAIDATRGRLWAVNSDLGASIKPSAVGPKALAAVGIYDLSSGKALDYVDLAPLAPAPHLLNGITVDAAGNAYVTDSFSPNIYKIDAEGRPSLFVHDERFVGQGVNLNGIVAHPDGFLLVIKKSDGGLFRIPLARPGQASAVAIATQFVGGDGLTLVGKRNLVVIANRTPSFAANVAYALSSSDNWLSAKLDATEPLGDGYPTTAVLRNDTLYVVHSQLNELIAQPKEKQGELQKQATIRAIARVSP